MIHYFTACTLLAPDPIHGSTRTTLVRYTWDRMHILARSNPVVLARVIILDFCVQENMRKYSNLDPSFWENIPIVLDKYYLNDPYTLYIFYIIC